MSKEQKEKIPRDASWPEWYDGKTISETGFCEDFLESHPMKCINGRLFTVNGPVEDEEQIKRQILTEIEAAIRGTHSIEDFEAFLNRLGYLTDFTEAHWKLRLPQFEHFTRTDTLDPEWTPEYFRRSVAWNQRFGTRMPEFREPRDVPEEFRAAYIPHQRPTQLKRFYLYYYCELGILPKGTSYTPLSPFMRAELRKLDELDRQTRYLAKYSINTIEDLWADRKKNQTELDTLTAQRTKLQNRIRRAAPEEKELLRTEKAEVSTKIRDLRLRIQCADGIEERSIRMQENLDRMNDNERRAERQEITYTPTKYERNYER